MKTRSNKEVKNIRYGLISKNVLVGELDGKVVCWHSSGRWRWDEKETELDIVDEIRIKQH